MKHFPKFCVTFDLLGRIKQPLTALACTTYEFPVLYVSRQSCQVNFRDSARRRALLSIVEGRNLLHCAPPHSLTFSRLPFARFLPEGAPKEKAAILRAEQSLCVPCTLYVVGTMGSAGRYVPTCVGKNMKKGVVGLSQTSAVCDSVCVGRQDSQS